MHRKLQGLIFETLLYQNVQMIMYGLTRNKTNIVCEILVQRNGNKYLANNMIRYV